MDYLVLPSFLINDMILEHVSQLTEFYRVLPSFLVDDGIFSNLSMARRSSDWLPSFRRFSRRELLKTT